MPGTLVPLCKWRRAGSEVAAGNVWPGEVYQLQTWKASPHCTSHYFTPRHCASALSLPEAQPGTLHCALLPFPSNSVSTQLCTFALAP